MVLTDQNRQEVRFLPAEVQNVPPGAEIRKLASVDLADMPEGFYALRISLTDVVTGKRARAEIPFRKVSESLRDWMLEAAPREG